MGVSMNHVLIGDADNAYRNRIFRKRLNYNSSQAAKPAVFFYGDNSSGFLRRFPDGFNINMVDGIYIQHTCLNGFLTQH